MMEHLSEIVWSVVGIIATGLASWLTAVIINFINSKIKDKKLADLLKSITTIITDSVMSVFQEFVDALKKEGKFDEVHQKQAKDKCLARITSQLTEEMRSYIEENFGDIEKYLSERIESIIYQLKK